MSDIIRHMTTKQKPVRKVIIKLANFGSVVKLIILNDVDGLIDAVENGVNAGVARELPHAFNLGRSRLAGILGVSDKTAQRWSQHQDAKLPRAIGEKAIRLLQLRQRAIEVFEDEADAVAWLNEPNEAFGERRPIDHAQTEFGCRQVERLLTRIDQGVYS